MSYDNGHNPNRGKASGVSNKAGEFDRYGQEELDAEGLSILDDEPEDALEPDY